MNGLLYLSIGGMIYRSSIENGVAAGFKHPQVLNNPTSKYHNTFIFL